MQLAHHSGWRKKTYEQELGAKALEKAGKKKWNRRLEKAIASLDALFNFDRLYIGGGNAKHLSPADIGPKGEIVPNTSGILGGVRVWDLDA